MLYGYNLKCIYEKKYLLDVENMYNRHRSLTLFKQNVHIPCTSAILLFVMQVSCQ